MKTSAQWKIAVLVVAFLLTLPTILVATKPNNFEDAAFYRERSASVISSQAISYLEDHQYQGQVLIWVFFTDKGVYSRQQINDIVTSKGIPFTERAAARRIRHGLREVRFSDLPVRDD